MCGLVGVVGDITPKLEKVFNTLLYLDVLRGPHSTGITNIHPQGSSHSAKMADSPHKLQQHQLYKEATSYESVGLMGHNRWATVGDVNARNAHPFKHGDVVGMHNGTLSNWKFDLVDSKDFEVDSDCLIYNINKRGIEDVVGNTEGAFALTWHDEKDHTFNFIRNSERPLYYAMTKDKRSIVYASEDWMIDVACMRNGQKLDDEMHKVEVGMLYTWELPIKTRQPLEKPKVKKLDLYQPSRFQSWLTGGNRNTGNGNRSKKWAELSDLRDDMISDFDDLQGTIVPFFITGIDAPSYVGGMWAVEGEMSYWPSYHIRIQCKSQKEAESWLDLGDVEFEGRVNWSVNPYVINERNGPRLEGGWLCMHVDDIDFASGKGNIVTKGEVIHLTQFDKPMQTGPDGNAISEEDWNKLTKDGCANCSTNLFYDQDQRVHWLHDNRPICGDCHDEITEEIAAQNN